MCKKDYQNLYKVHLNNQNNIVSGVGTAKFSLNFPSHLQKEKKCYIYVETAQVQVAVNAGIDLTNDFYSINCNLTNQNSYSNNNKNFSAVLCNLSPMRIQGQNAGDEYVELLNPSTPLYIGYLPNQIELYISDPTNANEGNHLTLTGCKLRLTLCIQFIDDDENY